MAKAPHVVLQFRRRGSEDTWTDQSRFLFCVFEHERHLAEERAAELNRKGYKDTEWRVKPKEELE